MDWYAQECQTEFALEDRDHYEEVLLTHAPTDQNSATLREVPAQTDNTTERPGRLGKTAKPTDEGIRPIGGQHPTSTANIVDPRS